VAGDLAVIRSAFHSPDDESSGRGVRPVIFDVLGPDMETSLLPRDLRLVLHVNPTSMTIKYQRVVQRMQTRGGFVEQHWGDGTQGIDFDMATGGIMRLYSGLSNIQNPKYGGTRRETIAYDKYLDLLALFHNNGSVFDSRGNIVLQGIIKITFDGGVYLGWFSTFTVTESTEKPYQFTMSSSFEVEREVMVWRTILANSGAASDAAPRTVETAQSPLADPNSGFFPGVGG